MNKKTKILLVILSLICVGLLIWFFVWYADTGAEENVVPDAVEATEATITQALPATETLADGFTLSS